MTVTEIISREGRLLALEEFIRDFGWSRSYGGGSEYGITFDGRSYTVLDCWKGKTYGIRRLAEELLDKFDNPVYSRDLATETWKAPA